MKTLIVCSEQDMAHLLDVRFRKGGYEVVMARTGDEGLEKARLEKPDVVILDPQVPGEHGLGLVRHLKAVVEPAPVLVVLSAETGLDQVEAAFANGADDFVFQPFSPLGLLERVEVTLVRAGRRVQAPEAP